MFGAQLHESRGCNTEVPVGAEWKFQFPSFVRGKPLLILNLGGTGEGFAHVWKHTHSTEVPVDVND